MSIKFYARSTINRQLNNIYHNLPICFASNHLKSKSKSSFYIRLLVKFDVRNIKFELKKGEKVKIRDILDRLYFQRSIRRNTWNRKLQF